MAGNVLRDPDADGAVWLHLRASSRVFAQPQARLLVRLHAKHAVRRHRSIRPTRLHQVPRLRRAESLRQHVRGGPRTSGGGPMIDTRTVKPMPDVDGDQSVNGHELDQTEPTTWEVFTLNHVRGEIEQPQRSLISSPFGRVATDLPGAPTPLRRDGVGQDMDGAVLCGRPNARGVLRPLFPLGRVRPLVNGRTVAMLGVGAEVFELFLRFVAPTRPGRPGLLEALLDPVPSLVVHDGTMWASAMHKSAEIKEAEGCATFRRHLIRPCIAVGAATLACDHLPNPTMRRAAATDSEQCIKATQSTARGSCWKTSSRSGATCEAHRTCT